MKQFNDLEFRQHPNNPYGIIAEMDFPNGLTISVIQGYGFYCSPETYEVMVFLRESALTLDTSDLPIDDPFGWQTKDDVSELMKKCQEIS